MHGYCSVNGTGEYFERSRKLPGRLGGTSGGKVNTGTIARTTVSIA